MTKSIPSYMDFWEDRLQRARRFILRNEWGHPLVVFKLPKPPFVRSNRKLTLRPLHSVKPIRSGVACSAIFTTVGGVELFAMPVGDPCNWVRDGLILSTKYIHEDSTQRIDRVELSMPENLL